MRGIPWDSQLGFTLALQGCARFLELYAAVVAAWEPSDTVPPSLGVMFWSAHGLRFRQSFCWNAHSFSISGVTASMPAQSGKKVS